MCRINLNIEVYLFVCTLFSSPEAIVTPSPNLHRETSEIKWSLNYYFRDTQPTEMFLIDQKTLSHELDGSSKVNSLP